MSNVLEKIYTLAEKLSPQDQQQVLDMIEELAQAHQERSSLSKLPPGTSGKDLLALNFSMSPENIDAMEKAIEDCERFEPDNDHLCSCFI